jgi:hypothetical protein
VGGEVADETEMRTEPRVGKHAPGIAANGKDLAALDEMMPVELEGIRLLSNASLVGARPESSLDFQRRSRESCFTGARRGERAMQLEVVKDYYGKLLKSSKDLKTSVVIPPLLQRHVPAPRFRGPRIQRRI